MSEKPKEVPMIGCRDECGARVPADEVNNGGWDYLEIQRRYRCRKCSLRLAAINTPEVRNEPTPGEL